ncbi:MAG: hypothetical protein FJ304_17210 [Planctomycetes bacterium]|nr:hypothetical protein [Planctomycetota bacterium]
MKNDAKLGMLAGVLGVIVAAVLFANNPPPPDARPQAAAPPEPKPKPAPTATAVPSPAPDAEQPSTPVVRTRKEPDAQPASRSGLAEEEP